MIHQRTSSSTRPARPQAKRSAQLPSPRGGTEPANPNAQLRSYHDGRPPGVSHAIEPLHRDDCCLVSDRGGAVVIMSAQAGERPHYLRQFPFSDSAEEYIR